MDRGKNSAPSRTPANTNESRWSENWENDRREQQELANIRALVKDDAVQDTVRWLLDNPSPEEKVHLLEMQNLLVGLVKILTRRMEGYYSPKHGWQWSATVADVLSLLEKAGKVREKIGWAVLLPKELPGDKTESQPLEIPVDIPTLHEFRYKIGTLTHKRAAEYLGCDPRTIRNYLQKGELTKAKGGKVRCDDKWSKKIRDKYPSVRTM